MTREDRSTQTRVGIFILIGIVVVAGMVIYFGRLGEGLTSSYDLRVEFPNASGLMRGSEVLLAGAPIGRVADGPTILPNMDGVYVTLRIFGDVEIPSASSFSVGSSGLLGDKYIQIVLESGAKESSPIEPGTTIKGTYDSGGIGGMAESAEELITELRAAVANINSIAKKVDTGVLSDEGIKSLSETLTNLKTTSERLTVATESVDKVVLNANTAVDESKVTMASVREAADELDRTLSDIRGLVREIKQGRGVIGALISDREMADNVRALVINLRKHGVLWYKDRANAPER